MDMQIRNIRKDEFEEVYELVETAFKTAEVSDGSEQDFVNELRAGENYIQDLEFVCVKDEELIGHVMLTHKSFNTQSGNKDALLLAPLCVKEEYRSKGVGSALVNHALSCAEKLGYKVVFLVGNPDYYGRFGFKQTGSFGIKNASEIPDRFVLACEIEKGVLDGSNGQINIE